MRGICEKRDIIRSLTPKREKSSRISDKKGTFLNFCFAAIYSNVLISLLSLPYNTSHLCLLYDLCIRSKAKYCM